MGNVDKEIKTRTSKCDQLERRLQSQNQVLALCKGQIKSLVNIVISVLEQVITKC